MSRLVMILILVLAVVAACGGQPASPSSAPSASTAAAVPDKPVTLRVANGEGGGWHPRGSMKRWAQAR